MRTLWVVAAVLFFSSELASALECLFCKSTNIDGDCRLGQRRFKPKLSDCNAPNSRCFALAQVSTNGSAIFKRGCTVYKDYCDRQSDVEFCQSCGAKFCNYWVMDLSSDAVEFLRYEQEMATLKATTMRTLVRVERLEKRRISDDAKAEAGELSSGVKDEGF